MNHRVAFFGFTVAAMLTAALALNVGVMRAGGNGIVASADGSGQFHNPELRTFTFTAQKDSSGTSSGQEEVFSRSGDLRWHADVDCLKVVGNVATMSGVVTGSSDTSLLPVGTAAWFRVKDNGFGGSGTPDQITSTFFDSGFSCTGSPAGAAFHTVEDGNVTVH